MALVANSPSEQSDPLQPTKSWQFVNINRPHDAKLASVRRFVRSNATKLFRRKQRIEALAKHAPALRARSPCRPALESEEVQDVDKPEQWNGKDIVTLPSVLPTQVTVQTREIEDLDEQSQWPAPEQLPPPQTLMSCTEAPVQQEVPICPIRLVELLEDMQKVTSLSLYQIDESVRGVRRGIPDIGLSEQCLQVLCHRVREKNDICRAVSIRNMPGVDPLTTFNSSSITPNRDGANSILNRPMKNERRSGSDEWLPHALQHPDMFLATMNYATVHMDAIAGSFWHPENKKVLKQKSALMNQINTCLGDKTSALSGNTISGVAMLTISEILDSNYENARIHMYALERMLRLYGGMKEAWFGNIIPMFISWLHVVYSVSMSKVPITAISPLCLLVRGTMAPTEGSILALGLPPDLTAKLYVCCNNMRRLTLQVEKLPQPRIAFLPGSLQQLKASTKEKLLSLTPLTRTITQMKQLHYVSEALRLSCLTYLELLPYPSEEVCERLEDIKYEFMALLNQQEHTSQRPSEPEREPEDPVLVVWTIFTVGQLASKDEEESWFARRVAACALPFKIKTWEVMFSELRFICWSELLHTAKTQRIWNKALEINEAYETAAREKSAEASGS
ncbi:uncharacterized protein KY384_001864 [Bacidia gigantensis]|uniref:uncharacterized protein n=1 Tax=Bacidia gigantensis TaxID=2732470 RepID=UPI001D04DD4B|nr:uncharacterized protein KY384_001864 [Bacidia gigantensis]KAG8533081.1 hypothetical protein KY384_001864 [Bacidia gigantensis]